MVTVDAEVTVRMVVESDDETIPEERLREVARQAVQNAVRYSEGNGHVHDLAETGEVSLFAQCVEARVPVDYEATVALRFKAHSPEDAARQALSHLRNGERWLQLQVRNVATGETVEVEEDALPEV